MTRLVVFALGWAGGVWLAQTSYIPPVWFLLALPATLTLLVGWWEHVWARKAAYALVGLLLGAGRMLLAQPQVNAAHIAFYTNTDEVTIVGVVKREPDPRNKVTNVYLDATSVTLPNGETHPVYGWVLLKAPRYSGVSYGDRVQASGDLVRPPDFEDFSYRAYLARQGVHALLRDAKVAVLTFRQGNWLMTQIYRFKARAHHVLLSMFPEPHASLLSGILLGIETGIPDDLQQAFVATGTSHIVAISGFNMTLIAGFFTNIAHHFLKGRGKTVLPLVGLAFYTILVGASAAVMRAAVMAAVVIFARLETGKVHGPTSLAAATLFLSMLNPYVLWDAGFQLSLAATLGLILYAEPLTRQFERQFTAFWGQTWGKRLLALVQESLIMTLAAQITTTSIIIGVFRRLSLVTLLTNLLILWAQPYVMMFGGVALFVGLVAQPIGQILAGIAWVFLAYTIEFVRWTAKFPSASIELGQVTLPAVWSYYLALFVGTWWYFKPRPVRQQLKQDVKKLFTWQVAAGFAVLTAFFVYLYTMPDGRLHVAFLNVGHGDAIFIQTPQGKQVLIDGGPDASQTLSALGRVMPFWDRHLDVVVLTSPDDERLRGLVQVLERYTVDFVIQGPESGAGDVYMHWLELLQARSPASVGVLWSGVIWDLDEAVSLRALYPDREAAPGPVVLRLIYGETELLLMGDATTVIEQTLVARMGKDLQANVLHVARHGAKTSTTVALLQAVSPEFAVITAGREGYPAPAVLARLMDIPHYQTDKQGTVEFLSDGRTISVKTEQK